MTEEIDIEEFAPWLVLLITLVGGALRVLLLDNKGLWLDETFSIWLASHSVGDMMQWIVKIDQHPPLYYLLLHYWIALNGDTAYAVRFLSVLLGAGTIPILYLIGKRMSGVMLGLAAAVFQAFSLFHIYYAQETRMYTLLTFNAAVSIYALVRLLTDARSVSPMGSQFLDYLRAWRGPPPVEPSSEGSFSYKVEARDLTGWKAWVARHTWLPIQAIETDLAWVAFIVFTTATLLSHNTAVLLPAATNIFVLGLILFQRTKTTAARPAFQAPSFGNWVKAQVGIFILWVPWLVPFIQQASGIYRRFWVPVPSWDTVLQVVRSFLVTPAPLPADIARVVWSLYGLVLGFGLVYYRKKITQFLFLAALFAIPFLGELIVSVWRPIFLDRTLIWTTIPLFLLLAAGAVQFRFRLLVILVVVSLSFINLFSASDYFRYYHKEDWSSAARDVAGFAEKGDLVLFNSNFVEIPFNYYFKPFETFYSIQVDKLGVPKDLFQDGILEPQMTADDVPAFRTLLSKYSRVWLVYSHDSYTDPLGLIPATLAGQKKLVSDEMFYGGRVQLYINP
jgi:mannosyltransferase